MRLKSGRMIKEKKEHMFELSKSKVSESEFISSDSVSCEDITVEMANLPHLI